MQQSQQQASSTEEEFSWYILWGARGLGIVGGVLSMLLGIWTLITIHASCMIAGMLEIATGFLVVALEAPFCCMWLDFIERIGQFSENRPRWQKAALYCTFGLVPLFFCFELSTFLGSGCIFLAGCVYGFLSLGRKATRQEMLARAGGGGMQASESQQHISQPADAAAWDARVDSKAPYP